MAIVPITSAQSPSTLSPSLVRIAFVPLTLSYGFAYRSGRNTSPAPYAPSHGDGEGQGTEAPETPISELLRACLALQAEKKAKWAARVEKFVGAKSVLGG